MRVAAYRGLSKASHIRRCIGVALLRLSSHPIPSLKRYAHAPHCAPVVLSLERNRIHGVVRRHLLTCYWILRVYPGLLLLVDKATALVTTRLHLGSTIRLLTIGRLLQQLSGWLSSILLLLLRLLLLLLGIVYLLLLLLLLLLLGRVHCLIESVGLRLLRVHRVRTLSQGRLRLLRHLILLRVLVAGVGVVGERHLLIGCILVFLLALLAAALPSRYDLVRRGLVVVVAKGISGGRGGGGDLVVLTVNGRGKVLLLLELLLLTKSSVVVLIRWLLLLLLRVQRVLC